MKLQRLAPDAPRPHRDHLAVLVVLAREVAAGVAGVGDDDAHGAHLDDGLGHQLLGGEQAVDVVGAFHQDLELPAALAAGEQELVGVLEAVVVRLRKGGVVADHGRDELARRHGRAVVHDDDADAVFGAADDHRVIAVAFADEVAHLLEHRLLTAVEGQVVEIVAGQHHEEREVDGVGALAQEHALRPLLAAPAQEGRGVLEVVGAQVGGQRLGRRQRMAVAGEDVADLSLRNGDQPHLVDTVLERLQEVPAAAQDRRLKAGLALESDQAGAHGALAADQLLQDPHAVVGDVDQRTEEDEEEEGAQKEQRESDERHDDLQLFWCIF